MENEKNIRHIRPAFSLCHVGMSGEDFEDLSEGIKTWPSDMGQSGWLYLHDDGVLRPSSIYRGSPQIPGLDPDPDITRGTVRLSLYCIITDTSFYADMSLEGFKKMLLRFCWKLGLVGEVE